MAIVENAEFEGKLWDAACLLRGNMDSSEYKHVILGLIFLKYISDSFEKRYSELLAEGEGFEEDRDEYIADGIFYVPQESRWSTISKRAHDASIGITLDNAMKALESENPKQLKGILPKIFARQDIDKKRLGDIVDLFTNMKLDNGEEETDLLGRAYEYCLAQFATQEGKNAGEFYTPACVVKTLVETIKPFKGIVYDPCCGSGGMFVQSYKFISHHRGNINDVSIYGQDSNPTTRKLALMNLAIRGIEADLGETNADSFTEDLHKHLKADFILANPPFNLNNWWNESLAEDPRWKYGIPPESNANFAWIQHMLYHLKPQGRLGLVLANTSLSIASGSEYEIRKQMLEDGLVEAVVSLPAQLFYSTKIKVSLWFIAKDRGDRRDVLFIDARNLGHMVSRTLKEFSEEDIESIAKTVDSFRGGTGNFERDGFSKVATLADIQSKNYNISPSKYVSGGIETDGIEEWLEVKDYEISQLEMLAKRFDAIDQELQQIENRYQYSHSADTFSSLSVPNVFVMEPQDIAAEYSLLTSMRLLTKDIEEARNRISSEIFKSWFVDFDFPDRNGEPYCSSGGAMVNSNQGEIPEGWNCINMGSFLTHKSEKVEDRAGIPTYSITNNGVIPRSDKFNKSLTKNASKNKVIELGDIIFGMSREIFNFGVMPDRIGSVSPAYHVYAVNSEVVNPEFLEFYMRTCPGYFLSLIKPGAREGQVLDKEELEKKEIILPPINMQNGYICLMKRISLAIQGVFPIA